MTDQTASRTMSRRRALSTLGIAAAATAFGSLAATAPSARAATAPASAAPGAVAMGNQAPSHPGIAGQCTWGAAEKFAQHYGYYPNIFGNANQWDDIARTQGFNVVLDAVANSVVVFEAGVAGADPTYGHVAWVDAVAVNANGTRTITITEMNGPAGPGVFAQRTVADVVGMSYILP